ncbi:MAG: hypothetical protein ACOX6P_02370 [Candidatus Merdivicinus sp.]|jgi:predicted ribosomally synthesized peptide with SipW-like signal peptide
MKKRTNSRKKLLAAILSTALICAVGVGGTVAWLHDATEPLVNTFDLANPDGEISEEMGATKKNVFIKNTGEVDAYIRVALTPIFLDEDGNIANEPVEAPTNLTQTTYNGYSINWGDTSDWFYNGGYFYYKYPVEAKTGQTSNLIDECTANPQDGLTFELDVSAQLIQYQPEEAVENSWKVEVGNGENQMSPTFKEN